MSDTNKTENAAVTVKERAEPCNGRQSPETGITIRHEVTTDRPPRPPDATHAYDVFLFPDVQLGRFEVQWWREDITAGRRRCEIRIPSVDQGALILEFPLSRHAELAFEVERYTTKRSGTAVQNMLAHYLDKHPEQNDATADEPFRYVDRSVSENPRRVGFVRTTELTAEEAERFIAHELAKAVAGKPRQQQVAVIREALAHDEATRKWLIEKRSDLAAIQRKLKKDVEDGNNLATNTVMNVMQAVEQIQNAIVSLQNACPWYLLPGINWGEPGRTRTVDRIAALALLFTGVSKAEIVKTLRLDGRQVRDWFRAVKGPSPALLETTEQGSWRLPREVTETE